jgi:hypothetical protein
MYKNKSDVLSDINICFTFAMSYAEDLKNLLKALLASSAASRKLKGPFHLTYLVKYDLNIQISTTNI